MIWDFLKHSWLSRCTLLLTDSFFMDQARWRMTRMNENIFFHNGREKYFLQILVVHKSALLPSLRTWRWQLRRIAGFVYFCKYQWKVEWFNEVMSSLDKLWFDLSNLDEVSIKIFCFGLFKLLLNASVFLVPWRIWTKGLSHIVK